MSSTVRQVLIRVGVAAVAAAALSAAAIAGAQAAQTGDVDTCQSTATKALTVVDNLRHPFTTESGCR